MTIASFIQALDTACSLLPEETEEIDTEDALHILARLRELGESKTYFACVRKYAAHLGRTSRSVKEANAEHLARTLAAKASSASRGNAHTPGAERAGVPATVAVAPGADRVPVAASIPPEAPTA